MGMVKRAYCYRCYPTNEQQQAETAWLAEITSVPLQQSLRHLDRAFVNFFAGRGKYPRFKSKKRGSQTATYTAAAFTWKDGTLTLAKMDAPLDIRWSRTLPEGAIPSTVTVRCDDAGRYFVSLLAQKRHARKQRGSKNREKARRTLARIHARIADRRRDYQHKLSTRLIKIDRWFPSSKTCSCCSYMLESLDLEVRDWRCPNCGTHHDRDVNAANTVLTEGLRLSAAGLAVLLPVEAT